MTFESKYRRQALMLWEASKEEHKKELVEEIMAYRSKFVSFKHRARDILLWLFRSNKRSSQ